MKLFCLIAGFFFLGAVGFLISAARDIMREESDPERDAGCDALCESKKQSHAERRDPPQPFFHR